MLKTLLNLPEAETDRRLREVCDDFGARVFAKVRVADVLPIEGSGIENYIYRYALQAHFDFVVSDARNTPLLAVEFDGSGHEAADAKERDRKKEYLCNRFELPLLRINRKYLDSQFSRWDLLRWFCTVFFVKADWDRAVESGEIHYEDSIFDPMFVSVKTKTGYRSLELERVARMDLVKLSDAQSIPFHVCSHVVARDGDSTYRAIAWIAVSGERSVMAETAMRAHYVGNWVHFAVRGIVVNQVAEKVKAVLRGDGASVPSADVDERVSHFERKYQMVGALKSGTTTR